MEPLTEKNLNVATVRPMSKIPTFGSSVSGIRPPTGIPCSYKRTLDKEEVSGVNVLFGNWVVNRKSVNRSLEDRFSAQDSIYASDQSKMVEARIVQLSPQSTESSLLVVNFSAKFQREHREQGTE